MAVENTLALADALGVVPADVVTFIGGGGKTSALYRLGWELAARGLAVVVSGTTRFTGPDGGTPPNLMLVDSEAGVPSLPAAGPWPVTVATGWGNKNRLLPVPVAWVDHWHDSYPDLCILLEADGSAMRPFKAPAAHEPVLPASSTLVVAIAGIDVVGQSLDERHVHRPEVVARLAGVSLGHPVDAAIIAAVLAHPEGGRRGVPDGARWVPLINKADTPERLAAARAVAALLRPHAGRVIIAHLRREPPVAELIQQIGGN